MNSQTKVKVKTVLGKMPSLWKRRVAFFANILSLFYGNDTETLVLRKAIGNLETYGSRLVPIINLMYGGKSNVLVLERQPNPELIKYFENELGLIIPQIKVLSHKDYLSVLEAKSNFSTPLKSLIKDISAHQSQWIDAYITDEPLVKFSRICSKKVVTSPKGSHKGNNKLLLYQYLRSAGLPVFETFIAGNQSEVKLALGDLKDKGYNSAVIKAQIGASGIGMKIVNLNQANFKVSDYIFYEGPCLVQGWLDSSIPGVKYIGSPSVQVFLSDDSITSFDVTGQFLSHDSVHEGNISPPPYLLNNKKLLDEIFRQVKLAGTWLHDQGYRGAASCDFHIIKSKIKPEVHLCEINARVTGATYPSLLSRFFLPKGAWLMRNILFDPPAKDINLLKALNKHKLLFKIGKTQGIMPFNFNYNKKGDIVKGQFLFLAKTLDAVNKLFKSLSNISSLNSNLGRN